MYPNQQGLRGQKMINYNLYPVLALDGVLVKTLGQKVKLKGSIHGLAIIFFLKILIAEPK